MNVPELLVECRRDREHFQLHVNEFVDEFRRTTAAARASPSKAEGSPDAQPSHPPFSSRPVTSGGGARWWKSPPGGSPPIPIGFAR